MFFRHQFEKAKRNAVIDGLRRLPKREEAMQARKQRAKTIKGEHEFHHTSYIPTAMKAALFPPFMMWGRLGTLNFLSSAAARGGALAVEVFSITAPRHHSSPALQLPPPVAAESVLRLIAHLILLCRPLRRHIKGEVVLELYFAAYFCL
jgi:hypothetical protein